MQCQLSGVVVPVYNSGDIAPGITVNNSLSWARSVQRPDGSFIPFNCVSSPCTTNSDLPQKLTYGGGMYQFTDEDDTLEIYSSSGALQSITYRGGYRQTMGYTNGELASITGSFGRALTFYYNPNNPQQLQYVVTPDGGTIQYGYDGLGRLYQVTYPDSSVKQYQYTDSNHVNAVTGVLDENQQSFASITYDPTTGYATASGMGGGLGVWASSINYANTTAPVIIDAFNVARTYNFTMINGRQKLSSITGSPCNTCDGAPMSQTYDAAGYYASQTDWNGNLTTYVYDDSRGLELLRTEGLASDGSVKPETRTITTQWESGFRLPHLTSEYSGGSSNGTPTGTLLRQTTLTHDSKGNLTAKTIQDFTTSSHPTRTWTYPSANYTAWGTPTVITGPRTDVPDTWHIAYYAANAGCTTTSCPSGQIQTVTDPLSHQTNYTSYDGSGRPLTILDANNVQTTLTYWPRGWIHTVTTGSNQTTGAETTTFIYWPTGRLKQVTFPSGASYGYNYNAAHQLTLITDAFGNCTQYTPDAMGNDTEEDVYSAGSAACSGGVGGMLVEKHRHIFNTLDQLQQDISNYNGNAVTQYGFDNNSNLTSITDANQHVTTFLPDALNRIIKVTDPNQNSSTYSNQANTLLGLNALDQLTSVTDPRSSGPNNLVTTYTINALGNLSTIVSPDTGTTQQTTFDGDGNVTTRIDNKGNTTTYQYDALDRLTLLTRNDGTKVTLTWDLNDGAHGFGIGRLTRVADTESGTTVDWQYDAWGHMTQKTVQVGSAPALVTTYTYDTATGNTGNLLTMTLPSNNLVGYSWSNGRISGMTVNAKALISSIVYQPFRGPITWTLGNNDLDSRNYDLDGRIDLDPVESIGYDAAGRVTGWTLGGVYSGNTTFTYQDPMNFVSGQTDASNGISLAYSYDASGNRLTQTDSAGKLTTYTPDTASNRLIKSKKGFITTNYTPDANGSVTGYGNATLGYDTSGRLISYVKGNTTASYAYDGLGARVSKTTSTATTLFNYDNGGHLLGEYTAGTSSNTVVEDTIYLGDMPVGVVTSKGTFYVHADYRNTPRQIDDKNKNAVWAWYPQPYGDSSPNQNPPGGQLTKFVYNPRYPGQYYDAESGNSYNYFRDYDSATGRYLESDPIGLAAGINTYAYTLDNPLSFIDPSGEGPLGAGLGGEIGGGLSGLAGVETGPGEAVIIPAGEGVGSLIGSAIEDYMAQNNKQIRKRIDSLQKNIDEHQNKLDQEPNCPASNHWENEIKTWKAEIERLRNRLPNGK